MLAVADPAKICRRLDALKRERQPHETTWRDCFDMTFPLRGSGFNSTELDAASGQSKKAELLDGTGTDSARILASGLMSGLTPANSLWFQLEVDKQSDEEAYWLDENGPTLWKAIHSSNFGAAGYECCLDATVAGWFVLYVDTDRDSGEFNFEQWALADCYLGASKRGGPVDIVYRDYVLTAEQAVAEFGEDCSGDTQKLAKDKPDTLVNFVHAIYPREGGDVQAMLPKRLPFASCHVEVKVKKLVRESGYHEFPCIVPRWHLLPKSVYAVGPAFDAMPDMKMLNTLSFDELANADIAIAGMWIAEDDGVLNPRTVKVGPRKIIVANSVDSMKALETGGDWQLAEYLVKMKQAAVRKIFMADQLEPQDAPGDTTAYEVHVRVMLIRQLLGPVYGRYESEYLQRLIDRCFGLAFRAGMFAPAPQSLAGRQIHVKYISPLARAQRAEEVTAFDIPLSNIALDEAELGKLLLEDGAGEHLFAPPGPATTMVKPRFKLLAPFKLTEKIENAEVSLWLGMAKEPVVFKQCNLAKIELDRKEGGVTFLSLTIQCIPALDKTTNRMLELMGHEINVEIRVEGYGEQKDLLDGANDAGEEPAQDEAA